MTLTVVRLCGSGSKTPLERLTALLRRGRFEPLAAIVNPPPEPDTERVQMLHRAVNRKRGVERDASNYLDARSLELVRATNRALQSSNTRLRLISRSTMMRQVEEEAQQRSGGPGTGKGILRHPRAFFAMRRVDGKTMRESIDRLTSMLDSLELLLDSAHSAPTNRLPAEARSHIDDLLKDLRGKLHGSANLASVTAMVKVIEGAVDAPANRRDDPRERVLRVLKVVRDEQGLMDRFVEKTQELTDGLDQVQQLLGAALQGQPDDAWCNQRPVKYEEHGPDTVITSNLYWMPYSLRFEDPDVRQWSHDFEQQSGVSLSAMLERFKEGFSKKLDFEILLSLAYLMPASDQWELARQYSELALTRHARTGDRALKEGCFFRSLCLRALGNQAYERSRQVRAKPAARETPQQHSRADLEQEALTYYRAADAALDDADRAAVDEPDVRFVKERAALMFYWWVLADGAERDAKEQQALEQSKAALELAADDASMRRQLYNNLCFYAVEKGDTEALMRYLVLFEGELASESVDQWPPNFIDTVLAAHSAIGFDPERLTYWSGLADALESSRVRQSDQAAVKRHVKEARAKLAALQSSSALN